MKIPITTDRQAAAKLFFNRKEITDQAYHVARRRIRENEIKRLIASGLGKSENEILTEE
jgi:ribosomal protein S24E